MSFWPNLDKVIINPGSHTDEGYISRPASDVAVIFANDSSHPTKADQQTRLAQARRQVQFLRMRSTCRWLFANGYQCLQIVVKNMEKNNDM